MKKLLALLLALDMCGSLAACGKDGDQPYRDPPAPTAVPTISIDAPIGENPETTDGQTVSIHTAEELFSTEYKDGKTYILESDLDLTGYSSTIAEMRGTFDGNGKTVRNASAPLIQSNRGTVQNLTMEDCQIVAEENAAILAVHNSGTVQNCQTGGSVTTTALDAFAGGVVCMNKGTIEYCANYADITAVSYALNELGNEVHGTFADAGGICASNNGGTISRCWNAGTVSGRDADYYSACGGITASNITGNIMDCYNTGTVIKPEGRGASGGIAGTNEANARIEHCYNIGTVSSGICGDNRDYIIDCYYLSEVSENGSGLGLNREGERFFAFTREELTRQETFAALDFESVWKMSENGPVLR